MMKCFFFHYFERGEGDDMIYWLPPGITAAVWNRLWQWQRLSAEELHGYSNSVATKAILCRKIPPAECLCRDKVPSLSTTKGTGWGGGLHMIKHIFNFPADIYGIKSAKLWNRHTATLCMIVYDIRALNDKVLAERIAYFYLVCILNRSYLGVLVRQQGM